MIYSGSLYRSRGVGMTQSTGRTRFMTVAEVAQIMRVSTMTVYRLIKAGELPSVRVGKSYRIREDDIDRYLAARYTEAG
jgi:excisionase family DNA binding protein